MEYTKYSTKELSQILEQIEHDAYRAGITPEYLDSVMEIRNILWKRSTDAAFKRLRSAREAEREFNRLRYKAKQAAQSEFGLD